MFQENEKEMIFLVAEETEMDISVEMGVNKQLLLQLKHGQLM